ncbi:MAG: hypothetical protein HYW15_03380 [Candidatus Giovannonibacteria bacterium]|nr:MAG: hypothetical protein HYW15_03380 [Candidatus Giovannonibacteria bacterium]
MNIFRKGYFVLAVVLLLLGGAAIMGFSFLPVLKVGGRAASYAEFLSVYGALKTFEERASPRSKARDAPATQVRELKRLALAELADNLFLDEMISKTDPGIFKKAEEIAETVLKDGKNSSLGRASEELYGLKLEDFKKFVLLPQAKRDALTDYYKGDEEKLSGTWLALKKNTAVKIYYPGFYWQDGDVKIK